MYAFTQHRPATVRQAASLLAKQEEAKLLAGGHTLIPTMKLRLAGPKHIVDLSKVEGLTGIEMKGRTLVIGAMTPHVEVATSAVVKENIPALADLAGKIGDPAVRHRGTIGGSIANNDPNADYPAGALGLGATIVTNKRRIGADEFFKGMFETALEPDEIIVKVQFPKVNKAAYVKFPNPASRYALVVVDMPFQSYEESKEQAFASASRIMRETGCGAVKIEGGVPFAETIAFLVARGIPVMGHIGLTPQSIHTIGSFRSQGKDEAARLSSSSNQPGPIESDAGSCADGRWLSRPTSWSRRRSNPARANRSLRR